MLSNAAAAGDLHWMAEHTSEDLGLPKERERERTISCAMKNYSSLFRHNHGTYHTCFGEWIKLELSYRSTLHENASGGGLSGLLNHAEAEGCRSTIDLASLASLALVRARGKESSSRRRRREQKQVVRAVQPRARVLGGNETK